MPFYFFIFMHPNKKQIWNADFFFDFSKMNAQNLKMVSGAGE